MPLALWHTFLYPWMVFRNRRKEPPSKTQFWLWIGGQAWFMVIKHSFTILGKRFHHFRAFHNILQDKWFTALRELKAVNFFLKVTSWKRTVTQFYILNSKTFSKKNATWRWQWALLVTAIIPLSFPDMIFLSLGSNRFKQMDLHLYKLAQCQNRQNQHGLICYSS